MLYSVVLKVFYFSLSLSLSLSLTYSLTHSLNLPHSLLFTKDFYAATLPASRSYLLEGVGRCWWRLRYILSTNSISANYSLGSKPSSSIEDWVCIIISPIFRVPIPLRSSFLWNFCLSICASVRYNSWLADCLSLLEALIFVDFLGNFDNLWLSIEEKSRKKTKVALNRRSSYDEKAFALKQLKFYR